jgi:Transcription factor e(y)2
MTEDEDESSVCGDEELSVRLMKKMMETGERDRLKEFLRDKLIQSGWRSNSRAISRRNYAAWEITDT